MNECRLSTIDNPFNPFDDFISWFLYDIEKGYQSCEYLAKIARLSDDMTEKEENEEIERAIDEIVELNPLGIYMKVTRNNTKS